MLLQGRKIIFTDEEEITSENVIDVLRKAETLGIDSYHPSSFTE